MWRFAAALPFANFAGFDFRDERGEADLREGRRFAVAFDRFFEELEALFVRR